MVGATPSGAQPWGIDTEGDGSVAADHVTILGNYTDAGIGYHNVTVSHADGLQIMERLANVLIQNHVIAPGLGGPWSKDSTADRSVNSAMILNDSLDRGTAGRVVADHNQIRCAAAISGDRWSLRRRPTSGPGTPSPTTAPWCCPDVLTGPGGGTTVAAH